MREEMRRGIEAAERLARGASVRDTIAAVDTDAWPALDAAVREIDWSTPDAGYVPAWERIAGGRSMTAVLRTGRLTEPLLALALCHRDGRIRDRAVRQATGHRDLLPLVVLRCAGWVEPVRERARALLAEVLDPGSAVPLTPLILRVGRRDRGDFAVRLVGDVLRRTPRERLGRLLTDADRTVRRFAYRLAVEEGFLSPAELARAGAQDDDVVVQNLCAEAALAAVREDGDHRDVLEPLLGARNPRARSAGVTALRRAGLPAEAERFLVDRSAVVRACARYVVRQYGTDPLPLYRAWCAAADGPAPGAVSGLGECGNRADAELLWSLTGHPEAMVRARAVAGLRLLDLADVRRLRPLLDDPAPGVVGETALAMLPSVELVPEEWLMERLGDGRPPHVRASAFRLLDARGGLVRLRAALAVLDGPDERLRRRAELSVRQWRRSPEGAYRDAEAEALLERGRLLLRG
ncbi:hypothetical protein OG985_32795 [Streptomyces sp. NBC_00289]|uniref:hypothetical protein n=1 Tax=Streptomyces sp. NBC_00289 TaxID=2975703 RepID=UPI0032538654